jgi:hypothetical protein
VIGDDVRDEDLLDAIGDAPRVVAILKIAIPG